MRRGGGLEPQMIAGQHYWSPGGYNDQEFRMRSAGTVVCSSPASSVAGRLA